MAREGDRGDIKRAKTYAYFLLPVGDAGLDSSNKLLQSTQLITLWRRMSKGLVNEKGI